MGEVYRARHVKLRRDVAIKVLPVEFATDSARLARFEREARTASALNHPNIVTIHDIAEQDGTTYLAMELVEGQTLRELIAAGRLAIDRVSHLASQIADGLAKAHAAGIAHRDVKPANVMVTADGLVKILDFGLAKPLTTVDGDEVAGTTLTTETRPGVIVGTPHYMSPEQLAGDQVDHRSDQFSFGIVMYEMVGGKLPFDGPSVRAVISAILVSQPTPLRTLRPDAPADLERIIRRCLAKDPAQRFTSTTELAAQLHAYDARRSRAGRGPMAVLRKPAVATTLAVGTIALTLFTARYVRDAERRWAERDALDEITRLTETGDLYQAYRTARRAARYRPADPALQRLLDRMTLPVAVNTEPPGAEVFVKGYSTPDAAWEPIGVTPARLRIPYALMRWKITKAGYEPFEGAPFSGAAIGALAQGIRLDTVGRLPPGMVRVPGGPLNRLPGARPHDLPIVMVETFFLDRYEVTNRQFKTFVDAGGYDSAQYWPPIEHNGKPMRWRDAVSAFRDRTGRPGPSSWEAGSYPAGEDEFPVGGLSWYEAAAYCAFAGRSLPTVYHWFRAIGQDQLSDILAQSNMGRDGKTPVGHFKGLGAYGTYDMAGNVKEWMWNAAGEKRYILGGAWNEPTYLFKHLVASHPSDREATNGVRCAAYPVPPATELLAAVLPQRTYDRPPPVSDEAFAVMRGLYAYDRTPLDAQVDKVNDSLPHYRRETVSFQTAYGDGRMQVHLLIPRDAPPPWQSVIWFPGDDVFLLRSSDSFASAYLFDFIPRAGRVLVYPVYKGMYERFDPPDFRQMGKWRDMMVRWSQDLSRTIDYLETRPDFDAKRIGYYGFSAGAIYGPVFTAIEPRIGASILLGGGLIPMPLRPEMHPATFGPRSRTPTLMINGIDDFLMPYEMAQQPLLDLLGAPAEQKRHARLAGGHIPTSRVEIIREVLDWLDRQFGPVQRGTSMAGSAR
jgi:predicted esterase